MVKIKTNEAIKTLDGKPVLNGKEVFTIGQALSNILLSHEAGGKMKMFTLATEAYKSKEMHVDLADLALIVKAVEETKAYSNHLVAGQILIYLDALKK